MGGARAAVEAPWPEALRVGGIDHGIGRDVPGQVESAASASISLGVFQRRKVGPMVRRGIALGTVEAPRVVARLKGLLLEEARSGGERKYFRQDIEVHGSENGILVVTAHDVVDEAGARRTGSRLKGA